MRVRLGLGLAAGGGAASPSVLTSSFVDTPKNKKFLRRARPLYRLRQIKNRLPTAVCRASHFWGLRATRKFWRGIKINKIF